MKREGLQKGLQPLALFNHLDKLPHVPKGNV